MPKTEGVPKKLNTCRKFKAVQKTADMFRKTEVLQKQNQTRAIKMIKVVSRKLDEKP